MIISCKIYFVFFIFVVAQTTKIFLQRKFPDLRYLLCYTHLQLTIHTATRPPPTKPPLPTATKPPLPTATRPPATKPSIQTATRPPATKPSLPTATRPPATKPSLPTVHPTIDCRLVRCARPTCPNPLPPLPGQCCPRCLGKHYIFVLYKPANVNPSLD